MLLTIILSWIAFYSSFYLRILSSSSLFFLDLFLRLLYIIIAIIITITTQGPTIDSIVVTTEVSLFCYGVIGVNLQEPLFYKQYPVIHWSWSQTPDKNTHLLQFSTKTHHCCEY